MKYGPVALDVACGKILGHNVAGRDGRRVLRKGRALTSEDVDVLRSLGRASVYVAELEPGDVDENCAAERIAASCRGSGLRLSKAVTGRVNLVSTVLGLVRVEESVLNERNGLAGAMIATLAPHGVVRVGTTVATVKIVPYAIPERVVAAFESASSTPCIRVEPLVARRVGLILSGSRSLQERLGEGFLPLVERVENLGSTVVERDFVDLSDDAGEAALVAALARQRSARVDLVVVAGETAIMDRRDVTPRAVERAGGVVESVGAPVDPGNLLMIAYIGDLPILGAPGCARSRKTNVVDWVLPRLLAGERVDAMELARLGVGGLLEDVPERPLPRSQIE